MMNIEQTNGGDETRRMKALLSMVGAIMEETWPDDGCGIQVGIGILVDQDGEPDPHFSIGRVARADQMDSEASLVGAVVKSCQEAVVMWPEHNSHIKPELMWTAWRSEVDQVTIILAYLGKGRVAGQGTLEMAPASPEDLPIRFKPERTCTSLIGKILVLTLSKLRSAIEAADGGDSGPALDIDHGVTEPPEGMRERLKEAIDGLAEGIDRPVVVTLLGDGGLGASMVCADGEEASLPLHTLGRKWRLSSRMLAVSIPAAEYHGDGREGWVSRFMDVSTRKAGTFSSGKDWTEADHRHGPGDERLNRKFESVMLSWLEKWFREIHGSEHEGFK